MDTTQRLLKLPEVKSRTSKGRTKIYEEVKEGLFPRQIALTARSVAWPDYEIEAINRARIAGKADGEIKELVKRLHGLRKKLCPGLDVSAEVARIFADLDKPDKNAA
jgi:prophage regulatory protein